MWRWWVAACAVALVVALIVRSPWAVGAAAVVLIAAFAVASRSYAGAVKTGVDRSRGFVLRHATVVSEILASEPRGRETLVTLGLAITPRPGVARLREWFPQELRLAPQREAASRVESLESQRDGAWTPLPPGPVKGPQSFRLRVQIPSGTRRLTVRYFNETLADVAIASGEQQAPAGSPGRA